MLYVGIIFTIVGIVFALCILVLIARIKLVIFFFEEAARIVFAMPLLLLEPALVCIDITNNTNINVPISDFSFKFSSYGNICIHIFINGNFG